LAPFVPFVPFVPGWAPLRMSACVPLERRLSGIDSFLMWLPLMSELAVAVPTTASTTAMIPRTTPGDFTNLKTFPSNCCMGHRPVARLRGARAVAAAGLGNIDHSGSTKTQESFVSASWASARESAPGPSTGATP
jgi:hypothetical protein